MVMISVAIVFGLLGFLLHFLWIPAIVVLAVLLGMTAGELRSRRTGGVISEAVGAVVAEAKNVADRPSHPDPDPDSAEGAPAPTGRVQRPPAKR
jgi:hypothetical protein